MIRKISSRIIFLIVDIEPGIFNEKNTSLGVISCSFSTHPQCHKCHVNRQTPLGDRTEESHPLACTPCAGAALLRHEGAT